MAATWTQNPTDTLWNTAANWAPSNAPDVFPETATFQTSNTSNIFIDHSRNPLNDDLTAVEGITFDANAIAFTINVVSNFQLQIFNAGIVNHSGVAQTFVTGDVGQVSLFNCAIGDGISFFNNAPPGRRAPGGIRAPYRGGTQLLNVDAGNAMFVNSTGGLTLLGYRSQAGSAHFINRSGGRTIFGSSTGGSASFLAEGSNTSLTSGGLVLVDGDSDAQNANFSITGGSANGAAGGLVYFTNRSRFTNFFPTAGNASFMINGGTAAGAHGGLLAFHQSSTAANAKIIASGANTQAEAGKVIFYERSKGETASVTLTDGGVLDISPHHITRQIRGLTIGSLEGDGLVFLGNHDLSVGSNNRSTVFSGTVQDGGIANTTGGGTLVKIGTAALTLSGQSSYTGGTVVDGGKMILTNNAGSATGFGPVEIRAGTLAGNGSSDGAVFIGTGSGPGAIVSPGVRVDRLATLSTSRQITFKADSSYRFQLNSDNSQADKIAALHVVIDNGAQFNFSDLGHSTLPAGQVFTVIDNMAPGKITGAFGDLPDGSTFTSNGNTYQVNYEGGTGNDLTLTVK